MGGRSTRAARVVARAGGGEVLVTRVIVDQAQRSDALRVKLIGQIELKGFRGADRAVLGPPATG